MSNYNNVKAPWLNNLGDVPASLDYFEGTMYEKIAEIAKKYPKLVAYDFLGKSTTYKTFLTKVDRCAAALENAGVKENDSVTICMPNAPQAVIMFYAINKIGGLANMVHPLSSENEIRFCLNKANSKICITLDQFYSKFESIRKDTEIRTLIIASVKDELPYIKSKGYALTEGRKIKKIPKGARIYLWKAFMKQGKKYGGAKATSKSGADAAAVLYSGGTTGTMKGILLTNKNFNALGQQIIATNPMFTPGDKMLAVMPIFHGFGLGVCIHSMLSQGGHCILIPRFNANSYAKLLKKHKPNFIAGVPTLYEALLRLKTLNGVDLSCLKGVFSGGDSLSIELKKKLDKFLEEHNATIKVREGYGTTECVTASCLTPSHWAKEGSIGFPFPDTYYKIVKPGTNDDANFREEGEICISGPTVMKEYINNPEETADTLRIHADGNIWLHTGDIGFMDEDGFIYFKQRLKRMIITSGYNVYPSQIENILDAHELVHMSCVIGAPDPYKMQKVVAFVVLKPDVTLSEKKAENVLLEYLKKNIAKYALPKTIEFRKELPKTLVGKVAYRVLEEQYAEEIKAAEAKAQENN